MLGDAIDHGWQAMTLETALFRRAVETGGLLDEALLLLLLGGVSLGLSQMLVLFVNQVPPRRFLAAIAMGALLFVANIAFWAASIWVAVRLSGLPVEPKGTITTLVGLAHAPYLFALFSVVPHVGLMWQRLLDAWVLVCVVAALALGLQLSLALAGVFGLAGWVLTRIAAQVAGPLLTRLEAWLMRVATGQTLESAPSLVKALRERATAVRLDEP